MSRVLAVDDESFVLRALARELRGEAFDLQTCSDPRAAMETLKEQEFDIVISDCRMPGIDGVQLLTAVRKRYPNTVRLMLSGQADMQDVLSSINEAGIFRYINKPWEMPELKRLIGEALRHRRELLESARAVRKVQKAEAAARDRDDEIERLEQASPGLTHVKFGPNDTIVIDPDMTAIDLESPAFNELR